MQNVCKSQDSQQQIMKFNKDNFRGLKQECLALRIQMYGVGYTDLIIMYFQKS